MRVTALLGIFSIAFGSALAAQTREVAGQVGVLGEWEMSATVTVQTDGGGRRWRGPLSMRHVGFCSADGAAERAGELLLTVSDPPNEVIATLRIDSEVCTFKGRAKEGYEGILQCPGRRSEPMRLLFEVN